MTDFAFSSVFNSAELDAFCSGIPVINYLDPYDLNCSNLQGIEDTKFVCTVEELCEALEQIESGELKPANLKIPSGWILSCPSGNHYWKKK